MSLDILPFARGSTLYEGSPSAVTDGESIAGHVYEAKDTIHGTGETVKLRAVINDTGSSITVARKGIAFGTAAKDFGRYSSAAGYVAAQGAEGKPLDDAYTTGETIASKDVFWVVEKGPCYVLGSTASTITSVPAAHGRCTWDANGVVDYIDPDDEDAIFGKVDALFAATNTVQVVWVQEGFGREGS